MRRAISFVAMGLIAVGCTSADPSAEAPPEASAADAAPSEGQQFPDITAVEATPQDDGTEFEVTRFDVTVSSPYDTPERYADAIRVRNSDGTVYGTRELTHDHADEQPFTRSLSISELPDGLAEVVVEGRDLANGWGGGTQTVSLAP